MKLRMLGLLFAIPVITLGVACEESGEGEEAAGGAAAPAEGAMPAEGAAPAEGAKPEGGEGEKAAAGPGDACDKLLEAIGAKNVEGVVAMTGEGADKITADSIGHIQSTLASASCGDANVEGDKAIVPVTAGEETREIVFAKAGDAWKFDAAAYMAKYGGNGKEKGKGKEKKEKAKKGKKAKGKKKG